MQNEIKKIQEHYNHREYCGEQHCQHPEDHHLCRNCDICPENPGAENTHWTEEDIMLFFISEPCDEPVIPSCAGCTMKQQCAQIGIPGVLCTLKEIREKR